jgi:flagellar biogenesis protein FliO
MKPRPRVYLWCVSLCLLLGPARAAAAEGASPAAGPAADEAVQTAPGPNPALAEFERQPLRRSEEPAGAAAAERPSPWAAVLRLLGGLVVLGLGGAALLVLGRRLLGNRTPWLRSGGAEVLSRSYLDSRRYLALVRVGSRVLVLGVTPEGIAPLSEVTEEEEVGALLHEVRPASEAGKTAFQGVLSRAARRAKSASAAPAPKETSTGSTETAARQPEAAEAEPVPMVAPGGEATRLAREMDSIQARLRGLRATRP